MTLEQLRIFVAVAEREHVTRAAEAVNLTQSAVSAAIANLESHYGVTLFHRVGRRIELTEEGRLFLEEARAVLARATAAERALEELSGLKRGSLLVQASQTIASYWLPARLVAFRKAYPQIDVKLSVGNTFQVAKAVSDGVAQIGFVEGKIDDPALSLTIVDHDRLVIVAAPDHPWARMSQLKPGALLDAEWVLRESGSGTRSEFEDTLRQRGLEPGRLKIALELPSNEAVRAAVEAGAGVTAISELVAEFGSRIRGARSGSFQDARAHIPRAAPSQPLPLPGCSSSHGDCGQGSGQSRLFRPPMSAIRSPGASSAAPISQNGFRSNSNLVESPKFMDGAAPSSTPATWLARKNAPSTTKSHPETRAMARPRPEISRMIVAITPSASSKPPA